MSMKEYRARNGKIYLRFNNGPEKCPICGKSDWCVLSEDQTVAYCMRTPIAGQEPTSFGYRHQLTDEAKHFNNVVSEEIESLPEAPAHQLHAVYSLVIKAFGLTVKDYERMAAERGLTKQQMLLRGYTSSTQAGKQGVSYETNEDGEIISIKTIWEDLFEANGLARDAWKGVPGFYEKYGAPIFETKPGVLIPCRNGYGQIVGMQVRVHDKDRTISVEVMEGCEKYRVVCHKEDLGIAYTVYGRSGDINKALRSGYCPEGEVVEIVDLGLVFKAKMGAKYIHLSSRNRVNGTKATPKVHFAFSDEILSQARFDKDGKGLTNLVELVDKKAVVITEGLLKGDIIASYNKDRKAFYQMEPGLILSVPGVSVWKKATNVAVGCHFESAFVAYDQDYVTNSYVKDYAKNMLFGLKKGNVNPFFMKWNVGKGLDDFILSDNANKSVRFVNCKNIK